jgi:hypothetical protein
MSRHKYINWMTPLRDHIRLSHITIPGSHDAGMSCARFPRFSTSSGVITQSTDILGQLKYGARFFDIRVYEYFGRLYTGHFLGKIDKRWGDAGAFGQSLREVLEQVNAFLNEHKKETVILKISHVAAALRKRVVTYIERTLPSTRIYRNQHGISIAGETMGNLRGKVLVVYEENFKSKVQTKEITYYKNCKVGKSKKSTMQSRFLEMWKIETHNGRLILRGQYANKLKLNDIYADQEKKMKYWYTKHRKECDELMQLYWTSTGKFGHLNIAYNTALIWLDSAKARLHKLIKEYKPNIVMIDFIDDEKIEAILGEHHYITRQNGRLVRH